MVFSSPIFIFLFLPLVLVSVFLVRKEFRNLVLLVASLFFYAWGEVEALLLMLITILINYVSALLIDYSKSKNKTKIFLVISILLNLLLLGFFKYANFFVNNLNKILLFFHCETIELEPIHLPIGISFFIFQSMSYVIDVYRKEAPSQKNPINIALYVALFPQLIAGPIVRYHDIARQIISRTINVNLFASGVRRFIIGLGKKVLIANTVALIVDKVFSYPANQLSVQAAWIGIIAYSLQIYFDFSGYSDMAIGLGRMFGFDFLENFNYPYIAQSVQEFWRRWHISLSTWFRDYLYIPLGGNRKGNKRTYINLFIVFFVTGLWHGASWNFIIWGIFHGTFLIIERIGFGEFLTKIWRPLRHFYTLLVVIIGWVFFRSDSLSYSLSYLKSMFGLGGGSQSFALSNLYLNNEFVITVVIGIIVSTPILGLINNLFNNIKSQVFHNVLQKSSMLFANICLFAIFIASIMSLASGTYNPFIYYRF